MSMIRTNVARIAEALRCADAVAIRVEYAGSGDSGSIDEVIVDWPAGAEALVTDDAEALGTVAFTCNTTKFDNGQWVSSETTTERPVIDAVSDLWEQAIVEAGLSGFGNDDGGRGELRIEADGTCSLQHYYYVTHTDQDETTFDESSSLWTNCQRIAARLREIGATEVDIGYSGSGDSGEVDHAEVYGYNGPDVYVTIFEEPGNPDSETVTMSLTDAAQDMLDVALDETGHSAYANNDGGSGTFTITADGDVTLAHCDYYTETDAGSSHNFDADGVDAEEE